MSAETLRLPKRPAQRRRPVALNEVRLTGQTTLLEWSGAGARAKTPGTNDCRDKAHELSGTCRLRVLLPAAASGPADAASSERPERGLSTAKASGEQAQGHTSFSPVKAG